MDALLALVGAYCTSLDMAGASVTLMHLDDELARLIDHRCDCAMFRVGWAMDLLRAGKAPGHLDPGTASAVMLIEVVTAAMQA